MKQLLFTAPFDSVYQRDPKPLADALVQLIDDTSGISDGNCGVVEECARKLAVLIDIVGILASALPPDRQQPFALAVGLKPVE